MPLPTLLQPGYLIPPKWMSKSEAERMKRSIPIEYIINFLSDRIAQSKNGKPKIAPKGIGDRVLVLKSSTGSGKSTTLPSSLYTYFIQKVKKNIAVTQPRILTCIDIPQGIVKFAKDLEMDKNIGYNTGNFKRPPKEKGVIFCTTEIIAQQYLTAETAEDFMKKYLFIIIDEVHTRDMAIDRILFLMKSLLLEQYNNPECPFLILTSATFDESIFMDFFNVPKENYIEVEGFAYPKTNFYPKYDIMDCKNYAVKKALQIHIENIADVAGDQASEFRDIMIFVPTKTVGEELLKKFLEYNCRIFTKPWNEVLEFSNELNVEIEKLFIKSGGGEDIISGNYYLLPILLTKATFEAGGLEYQNMFSSIDTISLPIWKLGPQDVFDKSKKPDKFVIPSRRIIIGTNIAETGITIDSLKYCIDMGYEYHVEFNPDFGSTVMMTRGCTQGMVVQRKGRVGRKSPGFWYPCFTEETFSMMQVDQYADILMADPIDNLLNIIIKETDTEIVRLPKSKDKEGFQMNYISDNSRWKLESSKIISIGSMDFLEMPSGPALQYATEKLHGLGYIDDNYRPTIFGYFSNLIRFISPETKRMILGGFVSGAPILDLITISAFIYTGKQMIFDKKFKMPNLLNKQNYEFIYNILIGDELINCLLLWNSFQNWTQMKLQKQYKNDEWKHELHINDIKEWCKNYNILYDGWASMIINREMIIDNLLSIGINIYYNGWNIPYKLYNLLNLLSKNMEEALSEIKKFKEAIYSGFHMHLAQWNESKRAYVLASKGIPLAIKSPVVPYISKTQSKPQYIIVTKYTMRQSAMSPVFEFGCDYISVMDNYVDVDLRLSLN